MEGGGGTAGSGGRVGSDHRVAASEVVVVELVDGVLIDVVAGQHLKMRARQKRERKGPHGAGFQAP